MGRETGNRKGIPIANGLRKENLLAFRSLYSEGVGFGCMVGELGIFSFGAYKCSKFIRLHGSTGKTSTEMQHCGDGTGAGGWQTVQYL